MLDFFGSSYMLISFLKTIYVIDSADWYLNVYSQNFTYLLRT